MSTATAVAALEIIGMARDRVDGRHKVTVAETYPIDVTRCRYELAGADKVFE